MTAIRPHHTTLNQLILQFLPFALPPYTASNELYALGICHVYPIYSLFESFFCTHIEPNTLPSRTKEIITALHLPELERAEVLGNDIKLLLPPSHRVPSPIHHPRLEAFKLHIQSSLASRPHVLVAYTWIFYMALFSGGRYIRSKLRTGFAPSSASTSQRRIDQLAGLSFWNFPGDADGEDLKNDFKAQVATLSDVLTEEEKADIIAEGVHIMTSLTDVVKEAAETIPEQAISLTEAKVVDTVMQIRGPVARIRPPWILPLRYIFPMWVMDLSSNTTGMAASRAPKNDAVTSRPMQIAAE
ncbi:MAG: hypothetical protein Q9171_005024 [Xanthocarpia ochracea]